MKRSSTLKTVLTLSLTACFLNTVGCRFPAKSRAIASTGSTSRGKDTEAKEKYRPVMMTDCIGANSARGPPVWPSGSGRLQIVISLGIIGTGPLALRRAQALRVDSSTIYRIGLESCAASGRPSLPSQRMRRGVSLDIHGGEVSPCGLIALT